MRIRFILLALIVAFAATLPAAAEQTTLRLLHVNDVYEIVPDGDGLGGMAPLATLIAREKAGADHTLVTFGGDLLSPSLLSTVTKGAHMIALFNAIGVDVAVAGNHEFDFGPETFAARIGESAFPWLGANIVTADGSLFGGLKARVIKEAGPFRIGFFGVITPDTASSSSPGDAIAFPAVEATARAQIAALKAEGADVIIALSHLTFTDDVALAGVDGIDLVLGGHDHAPYSHQAGDVLIHKSGYDAHYLGVVDLAIRRDGAEVDGAEVSVLPSWRMEPVHDIAPDAVVQALVDGYQKQLDDELNVVLGTSVGPLDSRRATVRTRESTMGDLIADAIRDATKADVAMNNGGGIRGDRLYAAGHPLTRKDIKAELPFGNLVVLLAVDGATVRAALENGVSQVEQGDGRFAQVSGLRFVWDPAAAPGSRVVSVDIGGTPLDPGRTYTLATNAYMARGANGYTMFADAERRIDDRGGPMMSAVVMDYVQALGTVDIREDGRITARKP